MAKGPPRAQRAARPRGARASALGASGAGAPATCWVMQWMLPPPSRISRAGTPTTSRPGTARRASPAAASSRRSSSSGTTTRVVGDVEVHVGAGEPVAGAARLGPGGRVDAAPPPRSVMDSGPGWWSRWTSSGRPRRRRRLEPARGRRARSRAAGRSRSSVQVSATTPGRGEAGEVVDVAVGLVLERRRRRARSPSRRRGGRAGARSICSRRQRGLRLGLSRHSSVVRQRALAVDVDRAALEHERRAVAVGALDLEHLAARPRRRGPTGRRGRRRGRPRR